MIRPVVVIVAAALTVIVAVGCQPAHEKRPADRIIAPPGRQQGDHATEPRPDLTRQSSADADGTNVAPPAEAPPKTDATNGTETPTASPVSRTDQAVAAGVASEPKTDAEHQAEAMAETAAEGSKVEQGEPESEKPATQQATDRTSSEQVEPERNTTTTSKVDAESAKPESAQAEPARAEPDRAKSPASRADQALPTGTESTEPTSPQTPTHETPATEPRPAAAPTTPSSPTAGGRPLESRPSEGKPTSEKPNPPEPKWHKDWKIFYAGYAELLKTYVDDQGNVDYYELRRKRRDLLRVRKTFESITLADYERWLPAEKAAFWINAHNVYALWLVVDNYPIKPRWPFSLMYPNGIMQIPGARTKVYYRLVEREYTLGEMERDRLLKQFGDVRHMLALSHATRGAGILRTEPYYPDRLDEQLDDQVRRFLNDPRGLWIDEDTGAVHLSDMFIWYRDVLVAKYGQVRRFRDKPDDIRAYLNFIFDYLKPQQAAYLLTHDFNVTFIPYDWALNEQRPR